MNKTLIKIGLCLAGFVLLCFTLFVINQTAQIVLLAGAVHRTLGRAVLWGLILLYAILLSAPAVMFLRLPRQLALPASKDAPEYPAYLTRLRARLKRNPHLHGVPLESESEMVQALAILDDRANQVVRQTATNIFLSTAVSQNGHLDVLLVFSEQSRMIWRIAHLYSQRPSLRDFVKLYANVAGTALISGQLNELDVQEQVEPVISSALGSLVTLVPGIQGASALIASSVLSGSANAFLTLRVGMITKRYCNALIEPDRPTLRRAATAEAAELLIGVVSDGTRHLAQTVWKVSKEAAGRAATGVAASVHKGTDGVLRRIRAIRIRRGD